MSDYLERCAKRLADALNAEGIDHALRTHPDAAVRVARAVLEAGRLSKCPAAVRVIQATGVSREGAENLLRAAEDAAWRK